MYRLTVVSVLLTCASVPGWGCAAEPGQTSASAERPATAEFVPAGPVRTEREAVAAVRLYSAIYSERLDEHFSMGNGERCTDACSKFLQAIDSVPASSVQAGGAWWWVGWDLRRDSIPPGIMVFRVDRQSGHVESAPGM
ncbi:MAG TPA: hypothetical protein VGB53_14295 [Rubricoccaceae bacterium]|jgi:hypothetical protein